MQVSAVLVRSTQCVHGDAAVASCCQHHAANATGSAISSSSSSSSGGSGSSSSTCQACLAEERLQGVGPCGAAPADGAACERIPPVGMLVVLPGDEHSILARVFAGHVPAGAVAGSEHEHCAARTSRCEQSRRAIHSCSRTSSTCADLRHTPPCRTP